jgi:hypothetical protein
MVNEIIFENENARLLYEPIKNYFPDPDLNEDNELTEEIALRLYHSIMRSIENKTYEQKVS